MKAIRYHSYGGPEVLVLDEVERPVVGDQDVLVRVRASSVNPLDNYAMRGVPYVVRLQAGLRRPRNLGLGFDIAGVVEATGKGVSAFGPGDEVIAWQQGAYAEYAAVRADGAIVPKPENVTFEQAGAVPVAGISALQAVRDKGGLTAGQRVLVNGAAGGVGTFAVQIAVAYGAEVTGVCGTSGVDLVRSLGAAEVVDYTAGDFTTTGPYDLIIDNAGSRTLREYRRALTDKGVYVAVGGPVRGKWVQPLLGPLRTVLYSPFVRPSMRPFLSRENRDDLAALADLMADRGVTPVVGATFPLDAVPDALREFVKGHARGKMVITV
jgi:NADPH:quinone reductase-like Zn-dependent oxidoreductase